MDPTGLLGEGSPIDKLLGLAPILTVILIVVAVVTYGAMRLIERTQERTEAMIYKAIELGRTMERQSA